MSLRMIKDVLRTRDIATHCPLCGRDAAKAPHTQEHIFPLWLQQQNDLLNKKLTIPNLLGKRYKSVKIGICKKCNNETFSTLENGLSQAFKSSDASKTSRLDSHDVALWLAKIHWLVSRKSHSAEDYRTQRSRRRARILPDDLMRGLHHVGMLLRCFARGKAMHACTLEDPQLPVLCLGPFYSLYTFEIDTRDVSREKFDFIDNSGVAGVALRSGVIGLICLFDGGLHRRFRSKYYAYLDGQKLHPSQFSELTARMFYDQTVLHPDARRLIYYWNKPLRAVVAEVQWLGGCDPYLAEFHDPARQAHMIGYITNMDPKSILFEGGRTATGLKRLDGTFMPFPLTKDEVDAMRREPGYVSLGPEDPNVRRRLAEEAWSEAPDGDQEEFRG